MDAGGTKPGVFFLLDAGVTFGTRRGPMDGSRGNRMLFLLDNGLTFCPGVYGWMDGLCRGKWDTFIGRWIMLGPRRLGGAVAELFNGYNGTIFAYGQVRDDLVLANNPKSSCKCGG